MKRDDGVDAVEYAPGQQAVDAAECMLSLRNPRSLQGFLSTSACRHILGSWPLEQPVDIQVHFEDPVLAQDAGSPP